MSARIPGDREAHSAALVAESLMGESADEYRRRETEARGAGDEAGARFWADMAKAAR